MLAIHTLSGTSIAFIITTIISAVGYLIISSRKASQEQVDISKILLSATILVLGYTIRTVSTSIGVALIAQKLIYTGAIFNFLNFFRFYLNFCKVSFKRKAIGIFFGYSVLLFIIAFTFDYEFNTLMYKSWEFVLNAQGHYEFKVIERGIFGYLYRVNFIFCYIPLIVAFFIARKKFTGRRTVLAVAFLVAELLPNIASITELALKQTLSLDQSLYLVPVALTATDTFLLVAVMKYHIYNADDTINDATFKNLKSAIVAFSDDFTFLGANEIAKQVFPYIATLSINQPIDRNADKSLTELLEGNLTEFDSDGVYYRASIKEADKKGANILWLDDITKELDYLTLLMGYQHDLQEEVAEKTQSIKNIQERVMISLSDIIENRDGNTGGHVKRTSKIVKIILDAMLKDNYPNVTPEFCDLVSYAAPMHDIGKISVSDVILNKPAKLDDDEYKIMKTHSAKGADLAYDVLYGVEKPLTIHITESIARSHHEKWDGTGYPENLKGEDIPLEARVMAIADVYDALVSKRCYKDPMPFDEANKIMDESFGSHFDPSLKKYFDECLPEIQSYYTSNK